MTKFKEQKSFERLLEIMDELREKCPWDKKQTFETLRRLTIEETYELADAITKNDVNEIKKELGDILLHIVFYAKIGSEQKQFDIDDVINSICEKLIFRHPHIYGDVVVADDEEVKRNWEDLKLKEGNKSVLNGVPISLPAMIKASRIQEKARGVGFDWEEREQVWDKVNEELNEVIDEANKTDNLKKTELEFGDLLFSVINAARLYNIDPELALERTNQKFIQRFNYLEQQTIKKGKSLHDMSLNEMNLIWEESKKFD
ncbi:MAG: nucleoside triphosphate pyrophosphohydrolase [Bacteroidetes bacterium CG02_land_8_20_14_3_00_31_25]|nr:nucleoside triphosphate pyrophosphohydrolase [Bacteroidota bacterium]PIV58295.1 MAG: nucleoside triphosphate pyrophosphohydrolase [Bacteroidetes bacterium CG02_land_8_20_14_3_00_31_25]PIX36384.1 MAG: nucleoside triphosphate pyrophosphohydrolase [Bacteroidetes bacterium CG_4_8_14_3_um_filter_31_14]PIY02628.1 MAG: nucleoside triphosphate pyrophosphohydrolase [Bacteroidetes bacterium CG_4_10_14_3_um_filter_31_20]